MSITAKRLLGGTAAAIAILSLAACSSTPKSADTQSSESGAANAEESDADDFVIGSMIWDTSVPFYSNFIAGQEDEAAKLGVELKLVSGEGDLGTEVAAIKQLIAQDVDAILVTASDATGIAPVVKEAVAAGIPVFAVNNRVDDSAGAVTFIGADDVEFGRQQARLLVEAVGEKGNVAYMMGALGTSAQLLRKEGFDEVLADYPDLNVVVEQSANWDSAEALALTQDWLNKYGEGELNAIVAQGPEAANSAKFAKDSGRSDVVYIVGDYPADVRSGIQEGYIHGTVNQDPRPQGERSIEAAVQWLKGEKDKVIQPNEYLELPIVTIDNVEEFPAAWGN